MTSVVRRYSEGTTGDGQFVRFTTEDESVDDAKAALRNHFSSLELPVSHKTNVEHGGYGRYSRYDIEKVEYWASHYGYFEVLNIKDAPDGHHPFVSYAYNGGFDAPVSYFVEWESIEAAQASLKIQGAPIHIDKFTESKEPIPGMIRAVEVNMLSPWFYATGNAEIVGDYVFPEYLANDPIYKFGRQFLVPKPMKWTTNGVERTELKTCMGASTQETVLKRNAYGESREPGFLKVVQWADGSVTRITDETRPEHLPVAVDSEPWLTEAMQKIRQGLAGQALNFTVDFADGTKFVGRFVEPKAETSQPEGTYNLRVTFKDGAVKEGTVNFKPTPEAPTVTALVSQKYVEQNLDISHIEVLSHETKPGGKKWKGVYYNRQQPQA